MLLLLLLYWVCLLLLLLLLLFVLGVSCWHHHRRAHAHILNRIIGCSGRPLCWRCTHLLLLLLQMTSLLLCCCCVQGSTCGCCGYCYCCSKVLQVSFKTCAR